VLANDREQAVAISRATVGMIACIIAIHRGY
jgi:hypothetical protein